MRSAGASLLRTKPAYHRFLFVPRTAGSVFRASTNPVIAHILARTVEKSRGHRGSFGHATVYLFEIGLGPSHATDFNFPVGSDPINGGYVRQAVGIRHGIGDGVVEQYRKGDPEFLGKRSRFLRNVLRDSHQSDVPVFVGFKQTLVKRKR